MIGGDGQGFRAEAKSLPRLCAKRPPKEAFEHMDECARPSRKIRVSMVRGADRRAEKAAKELLKKHQSEGRETSHSDRRSPHKKKNCRARS